MILHLDVMAVIVNACADDYERREQIRNELQYVYGDRIEIPESHFEDLLEHAVAAGYLAALDYCVQTSRYMEADFRRGNAEGEFSPEQHYYITSKGREFVERFSDAFWAWMYRSE